MEREKRQEGSEVQSGTRRVALVIAAVSNFMTPFMGSSVNLTIPSVAAEFKIDAVMLSWIATSYLLASAVSLVPFGRLADIYGRKRIFSLGVVVFTLFSLLCGLSTSAAMLISLRFCQGIGSGMVFATGMAILTSVFPPQDRGKALGIAIGAAYFGLSTGPFLGGFLTQHFTWRSVYLSNIPMGLVILPLTVWKLKPEWAEARGERFDYAGSILYTVAIAGIVYGISLLPDVHHLWIAGTGLLSLVIFILWERRAKHPVFTLELFSTNRVFALSCLAAFFHYGATYSVTFLLSLYLQHIKALSPFQAGMVLVSQPVLMAFCSPLAGRLSDRIEPRVVASSGMFLTMAVLLLFVFLQESSSIVSVVARLIILGIGFALFSSPNTNAIMGAVERRQYGIASGAVGTMRILGMMFSMSVVTVIFSILIGHVQITMEQHVAFMGSLRSGFAFFAALCFGGIFASMVRGRLRPPPTPP
jgi:EmrB/QacA subfamily drug resistance transporter